MVLLPRSPAVFGRVKTRKFGRNFSSMQQLTKPQIEMNRDYGATMHDAYQPLMPTQTGNVFVPNESRRRRDTAWTLCWATTYTACVVLGIFAFMHR